MSIDLKKMAGEFAISEHHVSPGDCETFARQVAAAVLDDFWIYAIAHLEYSYRQCFEIYKCEIRGEKEAGNDQG